ncbi:ATP-dependent zinc metalloprotease FtsH [bacterium]|jgi:cell division protease FtsH|nr:ATP-dependent zinc metalloprotease FtsH [bacterium]MBT6831715.1 ATP-dependent zinc metalloprotease FtsH [bacterium]MBT6996538.1 ATP-dependent zinc metalloprotease FtsH [bacterium]MBT7772864.1 ATP-dependent zinc metalloprotease FtsH [bacterium]
MNKRGPKNRPQQNPFKILLLVALVAAALTLVFQPGNTLKFEKPEEIPLSELLQKYEADELKTIEIKDSKISAESKKGEKFKSAKEPLATTIDLGLNDPLKSAQVKIIDTSGTKMWTNILLGAVPFILIIAFFIFLSRRASGGGGEGGPFGFGKSRAKVYDSKKHTTKFGDVAGAQEAKDETAEVVDFLKNPVKYRKMGAKIPKGILLVGPPGTGKTLLARAIAGEANVPFFSVSGSEFVEMFVGVGASRVRDLFKTAKRNAPCLIFIDEIDAIGKKRGNGSGGGHDEREQTLNQILTEMDGFEPGTNVIVLAATNRPDVLDNALLRPGRFDRRVHIDLPDLEAREKILEVHAKNKILNTKIDLRKIASKTVGFSGADLENVMNEAAIAAVKNRAKNISQKNIDDSVEKVSMGPERRSRKISEKEKQIIAHHEVGHAIAGHFSKNCEPVHKISVISRGSALGVTWFLPEEDTYLQSEQKMKDEMVSLHGGRIAERLIFGQTTTGASSDLSRISNIARAMVMTYGMGSKKLGAVVFAEKARQNGFMDFNEKEHSEATARVIDEEVQTLVEEAEKTCGEILKKHEPMLKKIATDLLKKETMTREEFLAYFE